MPAILDGGVPLFAEPDDPYGFFAQEFGPTYGFYIADISLLIYDEADHYCCIAAFCIG